MFSFSTYTGDPYQFNDLGAATMIVVVFGEGGVRTRPQATDQVKWVGACM